jgi:hypothetical protein
MEHLRHPPSVLLAAICAVGAACGGESGGGLDDGFGDDGDGGGGGGGGGSEDRGWASWAVDTSGYEHSPNPAVADVGELPVRESESSTGALFDPDIELIYIRFEAEGTTLTFYLPSIAPGRYDLSGTDGYLEVLEAGSGTYETRTPGGYGTLVLEVDEPGRLRGSFEGQYCFRDTPGTNCFRLYGGELDVADLATGIAPADPTIDYGVPGDYPALSSATRMSAEWRIDGSGPVEGRERARVNTFEGRHNLAFKVAPGPDGDGYKVGLLLTSLEPGEYVLGDPVPRMDMSRPFENTLYTSRAGEGGTVTIAGRSDRAIWGVFEGQVCYASSPGFNCNDFTAGRFSAALE